MIPNAKRIGLMTLFLVLLCSVCVSGERMFNFPVVLLESPTP